MSTKVLLKKSSVLGKIPQASDLSYGELALNYADGKLYFKDSSNAVKSFDSAPQLSLNDLTDVSISSTPATGQVLKWNGTHWAAGDDATAGGTGTDADTLDGFDSSYFLNYNNLSNTPTLFSGDYNDLSNKPNLVKAAVQWTANHTLADGTRYLAGDVVFDNGNIFVALFDNESLPTSNTTYWADLGAGNRLNIDGRDIPNITYAQLIGTPTIPTKTSDITNDSGYLIALDLMGYVTSTQLNSELSNKQDTLVSGTSIKTINGTSLLGSGDITISGGSGIALTDLSVSLIAGSGNSFLTYDNTTGVFTYTPADVSNKQDTLVSGTSIKTINGTSLLGSGDIVIDGGTSALTDLTDVNLTSPTNGQALVYDSATSKWTAQDVSGTLYTNTANTTTTLPNQVVDSFAKTLYRTVKYMIQATSASEVHSVEVTVMHIDTDVFTTVYNVMFSGVSKLFEVGAAISGSDINLIVTPLIAGLTIDVTRIGLVTRALTGAELSLPTDLETESFPEIDLEIQSYPTKDLN